MDPERCKVVTRCASVFSISCSLLILLIDEFEGGQKRIYEANPHVGVIDQGQTAFVKYRNGRLQVPA